MSVEPEGLRSPNSLQRVIALLPKFSSPNASSSNAPPSPETAKLKSVTSRNNRFVSDQSEATLLHPRNSMGTNPTIEEYLEEVEESLIDGFLPKKFELDWFYGRIKSCCKLVERELTRKVFEIWKLKYIRLDEVALHLQKSRELVAEMERRAKRKRNERWEISRDWHSRIKFLSRRTASPPEGEDTEERKQCAILRKVEKEKDDYLYRRRLERCLVEADRLDKLADAERDFLKIGDAVTVLKQFLPNQNDFFPRRDVRIFFPEEAYFWRTSRAPSLIGTRRKHHSTNPLVVGVQGHRRGRKRAACLLLKVTIRRMLQERITDCWYILRMSFYRPITFDSIAKPHQKTPEIDISDQSVAPYLFSAPTTHPDYLYGHSPPPVSPAITSISRRPVNVPKININMYNINSRSPSRSPRPTQSNSEHDLPHREVPVLFDLDGEAIGEAIKY